MVLFRRMDHYDISTGKRRLLLLFLVFCSVLRQIDAKPQNDKAKLKKVCTVNLCSFQIGVCTNGGTCIINDQCGVECVCPPGFEGTNCERFRNKNVSCPDTCTRETCNWQGVCFQNPITCNLSCNCIAGYRGETCDTNDPQETPSDLCFPLVCTHGQCRKSADRVMCDCDDQWQGDTCNIPCLRNCTRGSCSFFGGVEACVCPSNYTAESNCTEQIVNPITPVIDNGSPMQPLIVLIVFPIILLLLFALIVFVMWKKRMIFVMKIVYYLQKYEDSDGKLYDAFISFRSSRHDEFWVLNTLFPMLENEMGFRICVHFRDFLAGETISNNIIEAIEKSRRTILVVSPDYANGEWTRMEYQVAQQEMLSLRHKIIPIMFRDINEVPNVDKNLKLILNSITYIKWPISPKKKDVEKFWEQLRLTMPKKKEVKSALKGGVVINEYSADTKL